MKLWQKEMTAVAAEDVVRFTVGRDKEFDLLLAPFDLMGSIAHVQMLQHTGLLEPAEAELLVTELRRLLETTRPGTGVPFAISPDAEDVHSYVEWCLTERLGDTGKKIHMARSRNDQVLVDIRLYLRSELESLTQLLQVLFDLLQQQSERYKDLLLPGYTHLQAAMPSSFGLWFGAYAESLADDMITLGAAWEVVNKNPLGSAAGYGSSFPIDRGLTTRLLGFADMNYNVVYAQMGRGKAERITAQALANIADTLARMSMDLCLYLNQNFDFVRLPETLTTGSSIMPHKKNPDVFELVRGKCNRIKALPNEILMMTANLPSGYHRDLQLLKEHLFPAFGELKDCLKMLQLLLPQLQIREGLLEDEKYSCLFTVEEVNSLVLQGLPFRDAYRRVGAMVAAGTFTTERQLRHTHEGSIGNLCNDRICMQWQQAMSRFTFAAVHTALAGLAGI